MIKVFLADKKTWPTNLIPTSRDSSVAEQPFCISLRHIGGSDIFDFADIAQR